MNVNIKREEKRLEEEKQVTYKISEWINLQEQKLDKEYQKIEKNDWHPDYEKRLNSFIEKVRQFKLRVDWENKQLERLHWKIAEFEMIKDEVTKRRIKNKLKKLKEKNFVKTDNEEKVDA